MTIFLALVAQLLLNDFDLGKKYYERSDYGIARAFLEEYIKVSPDGPSVPEARYYLIRIADADRDFPEFWDLANGYLKNDRWGARREEIFNLLLTRLVEQGSFRAAFGYLEKYDYLDPDTLLRERIALTLLEQTPGDDRVWDMSPQTDSFRILRASCISDALVRDEILSGVSGFKGRLLRVENFLQAGDTVRAYYVFPDSVPEELPAGLRYRFTKICRLFNRDKFDGSRSRLRQLKGYENKADLLGALEYGRGQEKIVPRDDEENRLWVQACGYDTVSHALPDSIDLDSILSDTARAFTLLDSLRTVYRPNFHLDSLYAAALLERGRDEEAGAAVDGYLKYHNVRRFVLTVQGFASFARGDIGPALKNLILGQNRSASTLYRIAVCLERSDRDGRECFRAALALRPDSTLKLAILRKLLPVEFARGNYPALAAYRAEELTADTALLGLHLKSLARTGARDRSDSLYLACFGELDPGYLNGYGEYLMDKRYFPRARALYDSIVAFSVVRLSDTTFYNWALVPFQAGEYDTAQERFHFCAARFPKSELSSSVLFKIATIKYQLGDFDSAGSYYVKSAADSSFRHDALKNAVIAYKKAEEWNEVISAGRRYLDLALPLEKADASFEIGYACLRLGNFRKSINYFRTAVAADPQPEFHYWLAETYLGRGDFIRALYHYQAIVNKFPKDEMWVPTAEFKSGLALEFLDRTAEAEKLYRGIIKRRGAGDVWGAEAVKRLELLK